MSINACKNAPPLGLFGRFKLDDGRMDLKMGGIMPLFSSARVLAIKHGVRELSTPQRFAAVSESLGKMQSTLSNRVAPGNLSSAQRDQLKWALEQVPNVSNLLGDPLSHI